MKWKEGFVERDGVQLHYLANDLPKKKNSNLSLVFIPGGSMPGWIWEQQLDYFSPNYGVIAMDPRSQGDSSQTTDGNYSESRAQDILALVDQLHLEKVVLVGWSLACSDIVNVLSSHAPKIVGAVLVDGFVGMDRNSPFFDAVVNHWQEFQKARVDKTEGFTRGMFLKPLPIDFYQKLVESVMKVPTNTIMTMVLNWILSDFRPLLPTIRVPTLVLAINAPWLDAMKEMQKMIPKSRLEIFKDAKHALFFDQPEKFNQSLETFLQQMEK